MNDGNTTTGGLSKAAQLKDDLEKRQIGKGEKPFVPTVVTKPKKEKNTKSP